MKQFIGKYAGKYCPSAYNTDQTLDDYNDNGEQNSDIEIENIVDMEEDMEDLLENNKDSVQNSPEINQSASIKGRLKWRPVHYIKNQEPDENLHEVHCKVSCGGKFILSKSADTQDNLNFIWD